MYLIIALAFFGCEQETNQLSIYPKYLQINSGTDTILVVASVSDPIRIKVLGSDASTGIENVQVFLEVVEGDLGIEPGNRIVTTNEGGEATFLVEMPESVGTNRIKVSSPGLVGSPIFLRFDALQESPSKIKIIEGNHQETSPNRFLDQDLIVEVTDQYDNPINGANVTFEIVKGDGDFNRNNQVRVTDGIASIRYKMGEEVVENLVKASINGLSVDFESFNLIPFDVIATNLGDHIRIDWQEYEDQNFDSLKIYRSPLGSENWVVIEEITDQLTITYLDRSSALSTGNFYKYRVDMVSTLGGVSRGKRSQGVEFGDYVDYDEEISEIIRFNDQLMLVLETKLLFIDPVSKDVISQTPYTYFNGSVTFTSAQSEFYSARGGFLRKVDLVTGEVVQEINCQEALGGDDKNILDIYETLNGEVLVTARGGNLVRIVNGNQAIPIPPVRFPDKNIGFIGEIGEFLYVGERSGSGHNIFRVNTTALDSVVRIFSPPYISPPTNSIEISPEGDKFYLENGQILDSQTGNQIGLFEGARDIHNGFKIHLSMDGSTFYSAQSGRIRIYDTQLLTLIEDIGKAHPVKSFYVSDDGGIIVYHADEYNLRKRLYFLVND